MYAEEERRARVRRQAGQTVGAQGERQEGSFAGGENGYVLWLVLASRGFSLTPLASPLLHSCSSSFRRGTYGRKKGFRLVCEKLRVLVRVHTRVSVSPSLYRVVTLTLAPR